MVEATRRGQEARSSPARKAARPVLHSGTRRPRPNLLAPQGRHHPSRDGRLDARPVHQARLFAGVYAARRATPTLLHLWARRLLLAELLRADGARRRRVPAEANELSRPYPHLPGLAEVVPRSAGATRRTGYGLSLRTLRR